MRITYLCFSLLCVCLTSYAQPNPINRRAMAIAGLAKSSGGAGGSLPAGQFLRWKASDLPNNVVVSNQWSDEIQGLLAQQGDNTVRPTNTSGSGVHFDGTTWLTNTATSFTPNGQAEWQVLVIVNLDSAGTSMMTLWDTQSGGTGNGLYAWNANGHTYWAHLTGVFRDLNVVQTTGLTRDILFCPTNGTGHTTCFTNGIGTGADWNEGEAVNFTLQGIGAIASGGQKLKAKIQEIIVWTNGFDFTAITVSNIHYYSTNTYSFTP